MSCCGLNAVLTIQYSGNAQTATNDQPPMFSRTLLRPRRPHDSSPATTSRRTHQPTSTASSTTENTAMAAPCP